MLATCPNRSTLKGSSPLTREHYKDSYTLTVKAKDFARRARSRAHTQKTFKTNLKTCLLLVTAKNILTNEIKFLVFVSYLVPEGILEAF